MSSNSGWVETKLGDILKFKRGYDLTRSQRKEGVIPVISSSGPNGFHNESKVKGPGVVTGRYGTLGEVFFVENDFWPHNTTLYIKDFKGNNPKFIYYFLKTMNLGGANDKTSVPGLNRNDLHLFDVKFNYDTDTQRRIASILSAFDDKIELNRRMNQTLEEMAQALFREMCLPEKDNSKLEGWSETKIGDLIKVTHGYAFKGKYFSDEPTDEILMTPGNFKIGGGFSLKKRKYYNGEIPEGYILEKGELIVTMTDLSKAGDTLGYSAIVPKIKGIKLLHNQRVGRAIFKTDKPVKYFLYWLMRSRLYRSFILGSASGSTVKHTSPTKIEGFAFWLPPNDKLIEFERQASILSEIEMQKFTENIALKKQRDALLPKLMSGELKV